MFQLPVPPPTRVTHQIKCISCQEPFVISIDDPQREIPRTPGWRVPRDHDSQTQMRHAEDRTIRTVFPSGRARPDPNPEAIAHQNQDSFYYINCPRCGADNRNWLNALMSPLPRPIPIFIGYGLIFAVLLAAFFGLKDVMSRAQITLLLVSIVLAGVLPLLLLPGLWPSARIQDYLSGVSSSVSGRPSPQLLRVLLIFGIFVVGIPLLMFFVYPTGMRIKDKLFNPPKSLSPEDQLDKTINTLDTRAYNSHQPFAELFTSGGATAENALYSIYHLNASQPAACSQEQMQYYATLLQAADAADSSVMQSVSAQLTNVDTACQQNTIASVIASIDAILQKPSELTPPYSYGYGYGGVPTCLTLLQNTPPANLSTSPTIRSYCQQDLMLFVRDSLANINVPPDQIPFNQTNWQMYLRDARQMLLDNRLAEADRQLLNSQINTLFTLTFPLAKTNAVWLHGGLLFAWLVTTGLAWLLGSICASIALGQQISYMDRLLPAPIFTNLNSMTRVAVWELKKTLEVRGDMQHIQWMQAQRNKNGGIILEGLHRSVPDFNMVGQRVGDTVKAQRYQLTTDPWAKIIDAQIIDIEVSHTVNAPEYVVTEVWPRHPLSGGNGNGRTLTNEAPRLAGSGEAVLLSSTANQRQQPTMTTTTRADTAATETITIPFHEPNIPTPADLFISATTPDVDLHTDSRASDLPLVKLNLLSREICNYFSVNELRRLCLEMNIEYDDLSGSNRRAKTNHIVRYCGCRGLIQDLLQQLHQKRPHVNWEMLLQ
ncbi:MAG: hypothetical protein GY796_22790 [Chloroflexi bacterium]|nr:hypothetical protein [Chloroflexota bacterium]